MENKRKYDSDEIENNSNSKKIKLNEIDIIQEQITELKNEIKKYEEKMEIANNDIYLVLISENKRTN